MITWGGDTNRSSNGAFQPKKFTSYERDGNGSDEAMFRRYNRWQSRFDQPDPYDGSYDLTDPESFNRYVYVHNDPVNLTDPTGLAPNECVFDEQGRCVIYSGYTLAESSLRAWARYANSRSLIPTGGMGREPHGKGGAGPQNSGQTQKPKPKIEERFERAKQACITRKTAEANGERSQYVAKFPRRILRGAIWGGVRGAAMGGYAGANGGEALEPLGGGVPGAIGGGIVGGIFGAAAGTLTSAAAEPFFRMYHDWRTVNPALNRIAIDCDAEARTAISTAVLGGTP